MAIDAIDSPGSTHACPWGVGNTPGAVVMPHSTDSTGFSPSSFTKYQHRLHRGPHGRLGHIADLSQ
jgi:hypothetical protein